MKKIFSIIVLVILLPFTVFAYTSPGRSVGYVNDFANILNNNTRLDLESKLQKLSEYKGVQVAVVTVRTIGDETIESYATKLFEEWGIGNKANDSGVLLLIAMDEKKIKIENGYGVEHIITDLQAGSIIRDYISPEFKKGNYDLGVQNGAQQIINIISDPKYVNTPSISSGDSRLIVGFIKNFFVEIIFALFFLGGLVIRLLSKTKSWWLGGVIGVVVGIIFTIFLTSLHVGIIVTIILGLIGLVADYYYSKHQDLVLDNSRITRPPKKNKAKIISTKKFFIKPTISLESPEEIEGVLTYFGSEIMFIIC
jgi:uncharacterized protein